MNESVLIVEDNTLVRKNTAQILELANYKVFTAENGKIGVELARKHRPHLIICDIMMPELDGHGVLQILESTQDLVGTPFIFFTSKSDKNDIRKAMDMGADDYLIKPFDGDHLLRVVSKQLKKSRLNQKKIENNLQGSNDLLSNEKSLDEIAFLSKKTAAKKFRKKDIVFREEDMPTHIYYVLSGKIKTFKTNENGKEYITEIYKEGDFFGYADLIDDVNRKESALTIENSEITCIPKQDFFKLLLSNNDVALKFIKLITQKLGTVENKLIKMAYDSARKRVAEALLFIFDKYQPDEKNKISFPAQREDISAIAGISPESVSRNLTDFREEGLIETSNGIIKIINYKKLESLKN